VLTPALRQALALVDIRSIDHLVGAGHHDNQVRRSQEVEPVIRLFEPATAHLEAALGRGGARVQ